MQAGLIFSTCIAAEFNALNDEYFDDIIVNGACQPSESASVVPLIKDAEDE